MAEAAVESLKRVTLADVARAARVSTATVDRVVNGRAGVKARTRGRVLAKAIELGYLAREDAAGLGRPAAPALAPPALQGGAGLRRVALDFVLPSGSNMFMTLLSGHLQRLAEAAPARVVRVHTVKGFDPDELTKKLRALRGRSDGVGVIGIDHPTVREAMRELVRAETPVLTLVSDIANVGTIGYVGIDNRSAGRLAGHLLGRFVHRSRGPVALFAGALAYRGHEEREAGFRTVLRERFPGLIVAAHHESQDDPERAYAETKALLAVMPDLVGLYNVGAGNSGIGRALAESGRGGEVVFIGHDLSDHTRKLLLAGVMDVAIDQNPAEEALRSIDALAAAARGRPVPSLAAVPFSPIFCDNIPADFRG